MGESRQAGRLYVVGTPIGNLGDLSPRAAEAFRACDAVCCEDTRVTGKLLNYLGISKPLVRCDENVISQRAPELVDRLLAGETIAFASDAGMPSVSDPGQVLVDAAREAGVDVEVVPGPSACVTALVASGIPCEHFFFEGFLPRKHGERVRRLRELAPIPGALLFYESPHRVEASLEAIAQVFPQRVVALCRELTKLHEEVLRDAARLCLSGCESATSCAARWCSWWRRLRQMSSSACAHSLPLKRTKIPTRLSSAPSGPPLRPASPPLS